MRKKDKRARGIARREEFLKKVESDGLAALRADLERREKERTEALRKALEENRRAEEINKELLKTRPKSFSDH